MGHGTVFCVDNAGRATVQGEDTDRSRWEPVPGQETAAGRWPTALRWPGHLASHAVCYLPTHAPGHSAFPTVQAPSQTISVSLLMPLHDIPLSNNANRFQISNPNDEQA